MTDNSLILQLTRIADALEISNFYTHGHRSQTMADTAPPPADEDIEEVSYASEESRLLALAEQAARELGIPVPAHLRGEPDGE